MLIPGPKEIEYFLDEKASYCEARGFIDDDPVQIPHLFHKKEDIEIGGLLIPLDLHVARVAPRLGVLAPKQNDFKVVMALPRTLGEFRASDPVFYDYALFGVGRGL